MKTRLLLLIALFMGCQMFCWSGTGRTVLDERINWPDFMERQDMVWNVLPEYWYEAPFLGNGTLGLMVYKEPGQNYIRLETGNSEVHDHRKEKGLFGNPRLLTGHFALRPKGKILSGDMRLDLWNAEAGATVTTTEGKIRLHAFVHAENMVIIVKGETEGNEFYTLEWIPADADSPRFQYGKTPAGSWMTKDITYLSNPKPEVRQDETGGCCVQKLLEGGETAVFWKEEKSTNQHVLWVSLAHTYPSEHAKKQAEMAVKKAQEKGYDRMKQSHGEWWHAFYPKSFLSLDDEVKENFYWIQLYKLASATRSDRALIDNCGPWLTVTPWPNAWWNLNVELTYWALNASNHLDLAQSLENAIYNNVDNLRDNVPEAYRSNSLGIGRSSDLQCASTVVGIPGESKVAEVGLLTWACHNLWLIYRHKMDDALLREKLFPVLKGAINYYLHFLYEGEDGKLHLPVTYSPEYGSAEDCNFDLALLTWGCRTLLDICDRLNLTDSRQQTWQHVLSGLTPYPADENGLMIGKNTPYAFSHRHYSHLLSIYPLYLINIEQPDARPLIERSLAFWQSKPEALLGYSCTGASSISSALGKGNDALDYLNQLFSDFLGVNTLYKESGPVIETPLSGAQSIHDMLIQSWGGKLRVFPAVPDAWQNVTYHNWRTEGAFLVSAERKEGKTRFIRIYSEAGEPCTVITDIKDPVFEGNREYRIRQTGTGSYTVDLKKGEEVFIHERGTDASFIIQPVPAGKTNCFGKKK